MNIVLKAAFASAIVSAAFLSAPVAASAQMAFPDECQSDMASAGDMPMQEHQMSGMEEYQKAFMDGMKTMDMDMMQGMMKKDPDVAFACGMIAHHMGAISMSQVELKYGKSAELKKKAQKIIDDQSKEIQELTAWVKKESR